MPNGDLATYWVSGNAFVPQWIGRDAVGEGWLEEHAIHGAWRTGDGVTFRLRGRTENWFHVPIPTPAITPVYMDGGFRRHLAIPRSVEVLFRIRGPRITGVFAFDMGALFPPEAGTLRNARPGERGCSIEAAPPDRVYQRLTMTIPERAGGAPSMQGALGLSLGVAQAQNADADIIFRQAGANFSIVPG